MNGTGSQASGEARSARRALLVVENMSVPSDPRVWNQARSLAQAGWSVEVLCPKGTDVDLESEVRLDGVLIRRFARSECGDGIGGHLSEYVSAIARLWMLSIRHLRQPRFDVVQVCNPPDILFVVALPHKLRGTRVIFDQHDLCPELAETHGHQPGSLLHRVLGLCERITYRLADVVVVPNRSYELVAHERGGASSDKTFVVPNAPDMTRFPPVLAQTSAEPKESFVLGYVGSIGPPDDVENVVELVTELRARGHDCSGLVIGDGPCLEAIANRAETLGVAEHMTFTGNVPSGEVPSLLQTADVCVVPDQSNSFNDKSTMIKTLEYMASAKPVVAFDLPETVVSGGGLVRVATEESVACLADATAELIENPTLRTELGVRGRRYVEEARSWANSEGAYLAAFERAAD